MKNFLRATAEKTGLLELARSARHLPDRRMHPIRRRRVQKHLAEAPECRSVMFVCHGNIYRSPYAAYAFAALPGPTSANIEVTSAGFVGPGRPSPSTAVRYAAERGLDMSDHRSSLLTAERVRDSSLIIVMNTDQQRAICSRFERSTETVIVLGDLDPEPIETRTLRDPWGQSEDVLAKSYGRIDRCVAEMARSLFGG